MPSVHTGDFDCYYADDWFGPAWTVPDAIVIQAGFGRNGEYWRHWVPGLAGEFRVLRRDMRAHGGSTAGRADHAWSPEALADEVVWFLDALGLERVHYVGESVGGITGIVLGARYPERFATIALCQTPIHLRGVGELMRGEHASWSAALRELTPGGWTTKNMPAGAPRTEWERQQWDRCDTDALCRLADATPHVDVSAYLGQMRVPTLLLSPARSALTSLADQFAMRNAIPDCEIEVFEGRGHSVYQDEPERCIARLRAFIASRSGR